MLKKYCHTQLISLLFLVTRKFAFNFVSALSDFVELFVTLVHVLYVAWKVSYGLFVGFKGFTKLNLLW